MSKTTWRTLAKLIIAGTNMVFAFFHHPEIWWTLVVCMASGAWINEALDTLAEGENPK